MPRCLTRSNRWSREYYHASKERRQKQQASYVMRRYGVSVADLEKVLDRQAGRCAICQLAWTDCFPAKRSRHRSMFLHYLCIDHDHKTGRVRGLLCNSCNTAIGLLEEDEARCYRAVAYLRSNYTNVPDT
jgi:hypothetical protein